MQLSAVPKIAVIGCGCSTATEPVAEISHYWNITHVSIQLFPLATIMSVFIYINLAKTEDLEEEKRMKF